MSSTGLVWFRNDLRTDDNGSLLRAVSDNENVIAIYFFDPRYFESGIYGFKKTEKYRARFLLETIVSLKENLKKLNISLFVYHQYPEDVIPQFLEGQNIKKIYLQKEWTQEEFEVVNAVKKGTQRYDLEWVETYDQFLFHPEDIPFNMDNVPLVFTEFRKKCEKYALVRSTTTISPLSMNNKVKNETNIPSLSDLGFKDFAIDFRTAFPFKGGEDQALDRIHEYFWKTQHLSHYKKTRNGLLGKDYSSKLSAWLANGSISPRIIYQEVKKYERQITKNDSTYWLIFELIWRDFFKYISLKHGNNIFMRGGILCKKYQWKNDKESIDDWIHGRTQESFVNANMIELKNTGWMSNRGRQNVAYFFSKEQELDWRIGASYFESLLIDYDVHSNYGNWLYVSGVGNDPRDRKFNIKMQAERYDRQQNYQNQWLQPTLF